MVKKKMEQLRNDIENDLGIHNKKGVIITDSLVHSFLFEAPKKDCDAGMRRSSMNYNRITTTKTVISFTCKEF